METNASDWEEIGPEIRAEEQAEPADSERQSLTPKVLDLMEKISEYGYLTMREVQYVYGNKTWAYKVVNALRSQGLVANFDTLMSPKTGHHLTAKGYQLLAKLDRLKVGFRFKPERYSVFIFNHRMACARVGLALEKHPLVHDFLPESRLFRLQKSKLDKLCDGEFWYRIPGQNKPERVGLEVELTLKSRQRLDETFEELARRRDLDQVWWICADDNIRRALRREVLRHYLPPKQRHFLALMDEFLAAKGKAELMEPNGTLWSIDPEKPTLGPRQPEPEPPPPPAPPPVREPVPVAPKAPPEQPQPHKVAIVEPGSSASSDLPAALAAAWIWIRDSWSWETRYNEWGYPIGKSLSFERWGLVIALLLAGSVGAVGYGAFKYPWVAESVLAGEWPRWRARKLAAREYRSGGWLIQPQALRSLRCFYRLSLTLVNQSPEWRDLSRIKVFDTGDRPAELFEWEIGRQNIPPRASLRRELEFYGPASLKSMRLVLIHGPLNELTLTDIRFK